MEVNPSLTRRVRTVTESIVPVLFSLRNSEARKLPMFPRPAIAKVLYPDICD